MFYSFGSVFVSFQIKVTVTDIYIYIFTFIVKMPKISLFYVTEPKN